MELPTTLSADAAIRLLPAGSAVVAAPGCGTPETLLEALGRGADLLGAPTLYSGLQLGAYPFLDAAAAGHLSYRTWHPYGPARAALSPGHVDYVPARGSAIPALLDDWQTSAALIRISPPDANGWCSLGPSASYVCHAVARASVVLAEVDPLTPRTTGDSMIQIIDSYLKARLPHATVRSDAHISTGISKPFMLDWVALAKRQAASVRPDATVMFIGANDGFAIGSAACCGSDWIDAYAKRAETMMRAYLRDGHGRVYWLLLPPAGKPTFQRVFVAVNAALRQAAKAVGTGVQLLDDGAIVAPGGHFSPTLNGHVVRQDDEVHLSTYGASLVANEIIEALRRDGLVA